MTVGALNDITQLFMKSLHRKKIEQRKKWNAVNPDPIIQLPRSLDVEGNLSQLGLCCLLQYGLVYLFGCHHKRFLGLLKSGNISNAFRKTALSFLFLYHNLKCCRET